MTESIWNACRKSIDIGSAEIYALLKDPRLSQEDRLLEVALVRQLGRVGYQAAAMALDRVVQESAAVQSLDTNSKRILRWDALPDPYPANVKSDMEEFEAIARTHLRYIRASLASDEPTQVLISGWYVRWFDEWPPEKIAAELRLPYEIRTYPTTDWHELLSHWGDIRTTIRREPAKKHVFVVKPAGCPWFPIDGPASATTELFPVTEQAYTAQIHMCGMSPWDDVLNALAVASAGVPNVEVHWHVYWTTDSQVPSAARDLLKAANSGAERARILDRASRDMLVRQRSQQFHQGHVYQGTLATMMDYVERGVALARA